MKSRLRAVMGLRFVVVRLQVEQRRAGRAHPRPLIQRREVAGHPALHAVGRQPRGRISQDDVGGQVLILRAESVGDPRAEHRMAREGLAGEPFEDRRFVIGMHVVHRADDRHLVDVLGGVGQQFRHPGSAFAVLGELKRALHQRALTIVLEDRAGRDLSRGRLAVVGLERLLGIEQVDLRRPSLHAKLNDGAGRSGEVRLLRAEVRQRGRFAGPCSAALRR